MRQITICYSVMNQVVVCVEANFLANKGGTVRKRPFGEDILREGVFSNCFSLNDRQNVKRLGENYASW